jgi:heavy metal sensor kinase
MMRLRPRYVRTRLTLWYIGVLFGVLALSLGSTAVVFRESLREELDRSLRTQLERVEQLLYEDSDGKVRLDGHEGEDGPGILIEVWSTDGKLLYRGGGLGGELSAELPSPAASGVPSLSSLSLSNGTPLRSVSQTRHVGGRSVVLRVALSERRLRHEWRELLLGLLCGLPVAIVIAGLGGHWLAGRALGPLDRMATQAERLTADNLGERLPVENPDDELGHLARAFNNSLARIEESFAELRRFTADASHELRTPLTAIRAVGEVALQDRQDPERYREAIGSMLEEVDRLSRLVGSLLLLSRADAGLALRRQRLDLLQLARESAALVEILAEEKGQRLDIRGNAGVQADVDGLILRQALINLIDNAIKYSPRNGLIRVEVRSELDGGAIVEVADEGQGISEAHRPRVFERFYRVDRARSRDEGGAGLGLSIALWGVEAHGGRIELQSEEGKGSTFRIVLPRESAAAEPQRSPSVERQPEASVKTKS